MKKLFAAIILSFGLTPAWADWVYLGESKSHELHIRLDSIVKSGDNSRGWLMFNRLPSKQDLIVSQIQLVEARCRIGQIRILQVMVYSGQRRTGSIIHQNNETGDWVYPPPDSLFQDVVKTLCE